MLRKPHDRQRGVRPRREAPIPCSFYGASLDRHLMRLPPPTPSVGQLTRSSQIPIARASEALALLPAISCLGASPTPTAVRIESSVMQASEKPAQEKTWTASTVRSFHHVKCDALALYLSALRSALGRAQTGSAGVYDTFRASYMMVCLRARFSSLKFQGR